MIIILMLGKSPIKWNQRPDIMCCSDWDIKHQFKQNSNKQLFHFTGGFTMKNVQGAMNSWCRLHRRLASKTYEPVREKTNNLGSDRV